VSAPPIRVLIADDSHVVRAGLGALLGPHPDIVVVGHAANGAEAVEMVGRLDPDVVLMDIRMPALDGVGATERLVAGGARAGIIMMTTFSDDADVFSALRAGARGYLLKDVDPETLVDAIRTVAAGNALVQPEVTGQLLREFRRLSTAAAPPEPTPAPPAIGEVLTEREREILRLLAQGRSNQEIGGALVISVGTVKNHVSSILGKLGARDRTQAVIVAQQLKIV
jgi:DNA-binding NarL/FixJ family response regulator